jgi:hypothetical protein
VNILFELGVEPFSYKICDDLPWLHEIGSTPTQTSRVHSATPLKALVMYIHLLFDNYGLKCTLNASFCVQYGFDELG